MFKWDNAMPKKLHKKLKKQARRKGLTGKEKDRYIYGTLAKVKKKKTRKK